MADAKITAEWKAALAAFKLSRKFEEQLDRVAETGDDSDAFDREFDALVGFVFLNGFMQGYFNCAEKNHPGVLAEIEAMRAEVEGLNRQ